MERLSDKVSDWPVVITIHGIRTTGDWQRELTDVLTQHGFRHVPLGFGFFKAVSLLMPWSRARKVEWFRRVYSDMFATTQRLPSVVAHSFGSYIVTKAMLKYDDIRFDKMILCGSIVSRKYPWSKVLTQRGQAKAVLNEAGGRDIWAGVVEWLVSDAGSSGVSGFEDTADGRLTQLIHERYEHSDYFYRQNFENRWVPFLSGYAVQKVTPIGRSSINWKFRLTLAVAMAIVVAIAVVFFDHASPNEKKENEKSDAVSMDDDPREEYVEIPSLPVILDPLDLEPIPVDQLPPVPPLGEVTSTDSDQNRVNSHSISRNELISYLSGIWVNKSTIRERSRQVDSGRCVEETSLTTEFRFNDSASTGGKLSGRWEKSKRFTTSIFSVEGAPAIDLEYKQCMDAKTMGFEVFGEITVATDGPIDWGRMNISTDVRGCSAGIDGAACSERFSNERPSGYIQRINASKFRIEDQIFEKW